MTARMRAAATGVLLALTVSCAEGAPSDVPGTPAEPEVPVEVPTETPPVSPPAPLSRQDIDRIGAAQQTLLAGLPEQVHGVLGDLLERDPIPADVQFVAGSAAYDLHHYGEAAERLTDAVRLRPTYRANSSALGFSYLKLGDFAAARAAFQRIVDVAPDKHKAHYGLGLVALSLGDLEAARASLTESLRLSPDYLKALYAMARLLEEEGRTQEALETVKVVTDRWPAHDEALYFMGRLLTTLGREQEAQETFDRHRDVYAIKESLGGLAARLGSSTDGPALRLQMAALHARIGDIREARRTLAAARRLYPDDPPLEAAWRRLTQGH